MQSPWLRLHVGTVLLIALGGCSLAAPPSPPTSAEMPFGVVNVNFPFRDVFEPGSSDKQGPQQNDEQGFMVQIYAADIEGSADARSICPDICRNASETLCRRGLCNPRTRNLRAWTGFWRRPMEGDGAGACECMTANEVAAKPTDPLAPAPGPLPPVGGGGGLTAPLVLRVPTPVPVPVPVPVPRPSSSPTGGGNNRAKNNGNNGPGSRN